MRRVALLVAAGMVVCGCAADRGAKRPAAHLVAVGPSGSNVRMYQSAHHLLYTTFEDKARIDDSIATLEAAYDASVRITGIHPPAGDVRQSVFLFARRAEWEAFTRARAGVAAPMYLQLDRGGYTLGKACAVRDQGERDTLTVLAHEQMHLFIATHFKARPPPFLEEGLATLLERVRTDGQAVSIDTARNASRAIRLGTVIEAKQVMPLRALLSMHAGNVVGLSGQEVDAFYSQAWAFARFLQDGEGGKYRPALMRMISDASSGALSSDSLADAPFMVERYLGTSLEVVQAEFERFAARLSQ